MKKNIFVILILVLALVLSVFTGCGEKEPLRICVDIAYTMDYGDYYEPVEEAMDRFLKQFEMAGGSVDNIAVEIIPPRGPEREATLDNLRVEIASGSGPDLFIMNCDIKDSFDTKETLFRMPEKSMELGLFLPLNEYMHDDTQYAEWESMNEVVLAAGRNEEGQQIIPLSYTVPVSVYHKGEVEHTPSKDMTWSDMIESDNSAVAVSAIWTDNSTTMKEGSPFLKKREAMAEFILGDLADYQEEELLFSEEELKQVFEKISTLAERYSTGEFDTAPTHFNDFAGANFTDGLDVMDTGGSLYDAQNGIGLYDPKTMIPLYSENGGVTASITAYAAINRNTQRADDAYAILDFLLSKEAQRTGGIYQYMYWSDTYSLPMHNEVMNGKENSLYVLNLSNLDLHNFEWYMIENDFEALRAVREQITHSQFRDVLDTQLDAAYREYDKAVRFGADDPNEVISEAYRMMQRRISE